MDDRDLAIYRVYADIMRGAEPADWQWEGPYMSQRMYGITKSRAQAYAARHGGVAQRMGPK